MITEGRSKLIGIDASLISCGVCIYTPSTNEMILFTGDIFAAVAFIGKNCRLRECVAVVEDVNLDTALFRSSGMLRPELAKFKRGEIQEGAVMSLVSRLNMMAQGLGKSKAACDVIIGLFRQKNVPVIHIAPSQRHRADKPPKPGKTITPLGLLSMATKTTAFQFQTITGYAGRSSEHSRDAALLTWGKDMAWCEGQLQKQMEVKLEGLSEAKAKAVTGEDVGIKNGKWTILDTTKKAAK